MRFTLPIALALLLVETGGAQQKGKAQAGAKAVAPPVAPPAADWPMYARDLAGTRYSPLTQIDAANAGRLTQAWTYGLEIDAPAAAKGKGGGPASETTPLVVNGVMYVTAANRVVALDPETGREIWRYAVAGAAPSRRGVAYLPGDAGSAPRILFTAGRRLIALNAATGQLDPGFGKEGEVDMVVPYNSIPTIFRNVAIVGANNEIGRAHV